jgi:hypothetical protein
VDKAIWSVHTGRVLFFKEFVVRVPIFEEASNRVLNPERQSNLVSNFEGFSIAVMVPAE